MFFTQFLHFFQIPGRGHMDPTLSLDRFPQHTAYFIIHSRFHGRRIPERHIDEPFRQRAQPFMIMILAGSCQSFHGTTMERILGRDDLELLGIFAVTVLPGQLDGPFIGFCPAVAEEYPVKGGHFTQLLGRFGLDFIIE